MFDRRNLPLAALRAFESAATHLSLSRAGAALGVTHGAISHQVRALEQLIGAPLFERASGRLRLTSEGARLQRAVTVAFDRIIEASLHLDPESLSGRLIIGTTTTIASLWGSRIIGRYQSDYPDVEVEVVEIQPAQSVIPPTIDLALCYGRPQARQRRVEALLAPEIFPVASPGLGVGRPGRKLKVADLAAYRLLEDNQNLWPDWFAAMGANIDTPLRTLRLFSAHLCIDAARHGYGIAFANLLEVADDLRSGALVRLSEQTLPDAERYYLLAEQHARQPLRARLFEHQVKDLIAAAAGKPRGAKSRGGRD